jgi:UDP:flavonoid glycosyltransferase YjiC (YdhE family)
MLFTALPSSGHLNMLTPLVLAARDAGHEVLLATAPSRCANLERIGIPAAPAGIDETDPSVEALMRQGHLLNGLSQAWILSEIFIGLHASRMLGDLGAIMDRWRPDVVLSEVAEYAGSVAAERRGIARIVVPFGFYFGFHSLAAQGGAENLMALRRRAGLAPEGWLSSLTEQPCLLFAPPRHQFPGMELPANVHVFRPSMFDQDGMESLPPWIRALDERPLLYATLGTVFNKVSDVLKAVVQAVDGLPVNVVITIGRDGSRESLGNLPPNVRVEHYIPQSLLLPFCGAVLSHSGYNTVMATLLRALPMVLVPRWADQPLHAERCREYGVARVLARSDHVVVEKIREAILDVLEDPRYRNNAKSIREEIAQMPGVEHAVSVIEQVAQRSN